MKIIKPQTFSPFTFERASSASYYNSSGNLVFAANDVLREGYDPTTLAFLGPILENAQTNHLLRSSTFDDAIWERVGSPLPTIIPNSTVSPDGTTNAYQFMWTSGTTLIRQSFNPGGGTATTFRCFSVYLKAVAPDCSVRLSMGSATAVFRVNVGDYSALGANSSIQPLQNGWFRCSLFASQTGSQVTSIQGSNGNFYFYGAQAETGKVASSYIVSTSTKGTRAKDIMVSTSPSVVYTNVSEDEAPIWDVSTTYAANAQVQVLGEYHRVYEAISANTGNFPPDNPSFWVDTGPTNPWQMLDMQTGIERQTVANASDNSINITLAVEGPVDSVVLLNVEGSRVVITVRDNEGNVIGQLDQNTLGLPSDTGWWDFFLGDRQDSDLFIFTNFSIPYGGRGNIEVTVEGGSYPAKVGKLIIGAKTHIGCVKFGSSGGIIDFSRKQRDDFGNTTIVERRYIDKFDYDIQIETADTYYIKNFLASLRATPAVYIGSGNYLVTVVFGFYRDFGIILAGPKKSACTLQIEGL